MIAVTALDIYIRLLFSDRLRDKIRGVVYRFEATRKKAEDA